MLDQDLRRVRRVSKREYQASLHVERGSDGAMSQSLLHSHERLQIQVLILLHQLCQPHLELTLLRLVDVDEVEVLLRLVTDLTYSFGALVGEPTSCCLCRENHAVKSIADAFSNIADFTSRRPKARLHRVHNLSLQNDRLAHSIATISDVPLHVDDVDVFL